METRQAWHPIFLAGRVGQEAPTTVTEKARRQCTSLFARLELCCLDYPAHLPGNGGRTEHQALTVVVVVVLFGAAAVAIVGLGAMALPAAPRFGAARRAGGSGGAVAAAIATATVAA